MLKRGEPVPIHAKVTVDHGSMTIDLSGCSAERKAAINSRTLAGARVAYKALTGPLDPVNEGSFRALKVIIPEGNIMMARFPAPMSGWSIIVPTVVDTIVKALAKAMPRPRAGRPSRPARRLGRVLRRPSQDASAASWCRASRAAAGAAGRTEDGESGTVSVCQGDVRNGSIEGIELKCPVLVESRALRTDSGGAGKYRGGLGIDMRVRNLVEGRWNFEQAARGMPALGPVGRQAGTSRATICCAAGRERVPARWRGTHHPVPVDAEAIVRTGGGGGWGDPLERDSALVRTDVLEEFDLAPTAPRRLRRRAQGRFDARRGRDRAAAKCAKIGGHRTTKRHART